MAPASTTPSSSIEFPPTSATPSTSTPTPPTPTPTSTPAPTPRPTPTSTPAPTPRPTLTSAPAPPAPTAPSAPLATPAASTTAPAAPATTASTATAISTSHGAVALVPLSTASAARSLAELVAVLRSRTALLAASASIRVAVGISADLRGPSAIRGGVEEAGHARRLAEARGGGVVTSDEIYTHDLLLATVPDSVRRSYAARLLDPLLDYDRRHQAELVHTLSTFLDCAGSWNTCAERLHVHVNTVRYRIRRVEDLTGKDLSAMADRVDLFLALRAS
ncbi:helix-turn-helix domain-containing protein [Streptosporangiaceae bacterium NEAU-GS5]|nr:helix-turn-helix domain-containing protein [Streptosporangiaceae bacterium NEAU-GS5]